MEILSTCLIYVCRIPGFVDKICCCQHDYATISSSFASETGIETGFTRYRKPVSFSQIKHTLSLKWIWNCF